MLVASSLVYRLRSRKCFFPGVKCRAKLEVALRKQSPSVVANHSKLDIFYRKLSSRKRGKWLSTFPRISLKYSKDQRLNSTAFDFFLLKIVR